MRYNVKLQIDELGRVQLPREVLAALKLHPGGELGLVERMGGMMLLHPNNLNDDFVNAMIIAERIMVEDKGLFETLAKS
jgi:hypothetical protein